MRHFYARLTTERRFLHCSKKRVRMVVILRLAYDNAYAVPDMLTMHCNITGRDGSTKVLVYRRENTFCIERGMGQDPFLSWLATQPAFIEVGLGILFCLLIAPVLLAGIALGLTSVEEKLGRILSESGLLAAGATTARAGSRWEPLRRAVAQELPWLRKAVSKRHA